MYSAPHIKHSHRQGPMDLLALSRGKKTQGVVIEMGQSLVANQNQSHIMLVTRSSGAIQLQVIVDVKWALKEPKFGLGWTTNQDVPMCEKYYKGRALLGLAAYFFCILPPYHNVKSIVRTFLIPTPQSLSLFMDLLYLNIFTYGKGMERGWGWGGGGLISKSKCNA